MLLFALFSGLVNLASQSVFMRVVSAINGDYYLAFILTTLTFIVFSALGNLLAARLRRWLPLFELAAGVYSIAGYIGIRQFQLLEHTVSDAGVIALITLPALLLGMHLPAYAGAVRTRISVTYGVYHLGAAVGVLILEAFVLPNVPLSSALGVLGTAQLLLAFAVWWRQRSNTELCEQAAETKADAPAKSVWPGFALVFFASIASYLCVSWGLHAAYGLIYPARMLIGVYNGGTLLVIAAGALVAPYVTGRRLASLTPIAGMGLFSALLFYVAAVKVLPLHGYRFLEAYYVLQVMLFGVPVFLSAVIYGRVSASLRSDTSAYRARSTGLLMATSALGNLVGGLLSIASGVHLFSVWPPLLSAALFSGLFLCMAAREPESLRMRLRLSWGLLAAITIALSWAVGFDSVKEYLQLRYPASEKLMRAELVTDLGSVAGRLTIENSQKSLQAEPDPLGALFFIDGHVSHPLLPEGETLYGILPARARAQPFRHSLVLGLGSGQTALGVSMVSEHTDVVEISPAVFDMAPKMRRFNLDVEARPDVRLIHADVTDFLRRCRPGSYDLVSGNLTYPVMFSSYKMYTAEAVRDARRCLAPDGIFQSVVPGSIQMDVQTWKDTLAPVYRSFSYVYLSTRPYLSLVASNAPLSIPAALDLSTVIKRAQDLRYLEHDESILRGLACAGWLTPPAQLQPDGTTPLTTLDDPVLERDNTMFSLKSLGSEAEWNSDNSVGALFSPLLPYMHNDQCWNEGGVLHLRAGIVSAIRPPLVPLFRGPAQQQ